MAAAADSDANGFSACFSADEAFHSLIAKQSGNPFLEGAYRSLGGQVQRFRLYAELGSSDAEVAAEEHRAVYDAFTRGDAEAAADRMRRHVGNAKARSLKDRKSVRGD